MILFSGVGASTHLDMFSSSYFSEILILWMSKMWRRITNWPLILLRRNWAFLPSWQAKRWPRSGSLTSCPWWCTWPSSTRCSRTHSLPVVRAAAAGVSFFLTVSFISTPKSKSCLLFFYWSAIRVSPWNFAPLFFPSLLLCSQTLIVSQIFLTIYKCAKIIPIQNVFLNSTTFSYPFSQNQPFWKSGLCTTSSLPELCNTLQSGFGHYCSARLFSTVI